MKHYLGDVNDDYILYMQSMLYAESLITAGDTFGDRCIR